MPTRTRKVSKPAKAATRRSRKATTSTHRRRKTIRKQICQSGGVLPTCDLNVFTCNGKEYTFFDKDFKYDDLIGKRMATNIKNSDKKMVALQKIEKYMPGNPPTLVGCNYYLYRPDSVSAVRLNNGTLKLDHNEIILNPEVKKRKLAKSRIFKSTSSPKQRRGVIFKSGSNEKVSPPIFSGSNSANNSGSGEKAENKNQRLISERLDELEIKDGNILRNKIFDRYDTAEVKEYEENKGELKTYNITHADMIARFMAKIKDKKLDGLLNTYKEKNQKVATNQTFFTVYKDNNTNDIYICGYLETGTKMQCKKLLDDNTVDKSAIYIPSTELEPTYDEPVRASK